MLHHNVFAPHTVCCMASYVMYMYDYDDDYYCDYYDDDYYYYDYCVQLLVSQFVLL